MLGGFLKILIFIAVILSYSNSCLSAECPQFERRYKCEHNSLSIHSLTFDQYEEHLDEIDIYYGDSEDDFIPVIADSIVRQLEPGVRLVAKCDKVHTGSDLKQLILKFNVNNSTQKFTPTTTHNTSILHVSFSASESSHLENLQVSDQVRESNLAFTCYSLKFKS